jgi:hypothetical protein
MGREIRYRNYGLYIAREVGAPHHRPHGHFKVRGRRIASIFLETMEVFHEIEPVPEDLLVEARGDQERLLDVWEELNE